VSEKEFLMIGKINNNKPTTELPEILEKYQVIGFDHFVDFINDNSFLKELVLEAEKTIKLYFQNPKLSLQVVTDKEDPADTKLIIFICPSEPPKEAFDKLKKLRQAWWFDASEQGQDKLAINLRYR
jgi:hypothetical protein